MATQERDLASRELITFIQTYTTLLERQLESVRQDMTGTVNEVMSAIHEMSSKTEQKKREANEILVATYTSPAEETAEAIEEIQSSVTDVFERAQAGDVEERETSSIGRGVSKQILESQIRRTGGVFSKHMEALGTLDNELQGLIFKMVGALSQDDVISQRIEHVSKCLHAMQTNLSYLLVEFDRLCNTRDVRLFAADLLKYSWTTYTMNRERELHRHFFPPHKATGS